jgi:SAM-dependent methyltransferase
LTAERQRAGDASAISGDLARYYDLDLTDDPGDLDFYRALARRTGGPILELAVGTGRIAVPLAGDGFEVVGVDADAAMLERARERWSAVSGGAAGGSLELVQADLLEAALGARFAFIVLALNSLLLMGSAERQARALRSVARHLKRDGIAAIDVWLPAAEDFALYDGRPMLEWVREDGERGEHVSKTVAARYARATAIVELTALYDAWPSAGGPVRRVAHVDRLRLIRPDELTRLATEAGLAVQQLAGDYDLTPIGPDAERAILLTGLV